MSALACNCRIRRNRTLVRQAHDGAAEKDDAGPCAQLDALRHATRDLRLMSGTSVATLLASIPELNRVLAATKFLTACNFRVTACAAGECELLVPFRPELERPGGIVNGMTIMGAADVAMWLAIMTTRGTAEQWVTSDMKTAFLKPGIGESLLCKARVLRIGRRTAYGTVETQGASAGLLAHHVITYAKSSVPAA